MAARLDIVLFGATGFTGKHCIPYIIQFLNTGNKTLTWGVSGRNEKKLKEVLTEMGKVVEQDLSNVPCILADVQDEQSLLEMASRARLVINCCGPYRFYGEPVIKACLEKGAHHVDVSGEPQFIDNMQLKYHKLAQEKGVYIVSACGLDSIPADLGIVFLQQKFNGTVNSVETYLQFDARWHSGPSGNYGTWQSLVYGVAHWNELRDLRRKLYPTKTPEFSPKLQSRGQIHKSSIINKWCLPFLGSDRSVCLRTQRHQYDNEDQRPVQVQCYLGLPSIIAVVGLIIFGAMFKLMTMTSLGRYLLLKYPRICSFGMFSATENPSEEAIEQSSFSIHLYGEGWSEKLINKSDEYKVPMDKKMLCKVSGKNPGYGSTCVALVLAGIMLITENDKLPNNGGVYAPGACFAKTSLIEKLNANDVKFEVLEMGSLTNSKL